VSARPVGTVDSEAAAAIAAAARTERSAIPAL
jgi:hypothetical protein